MANAKDIHWQTDELDVLMRIGEDQVVHLISILPHGTAVQPTSSQYFDDPSLPLHQVRLTGEGNIKQKSPKVLAAGYVSDRLRYKDHKELSGEGWKSLEVTSFDEQSKITVTAHLTIYSGLPVIRARSTVKNDGDVDVVLTQVSSLTVGGLTSRGAAEWWHDFTVSTATNSWFREAQWRDQSLPDIGLDDFGTAGAPEHYPATHANYSISNHGSFSTGGYLPMGALKRQDNKETWLWQIESNGSWRWELADWHDGIYLSAAGPVDHEHGWKEKLAPGQSFTSVPAAVIHTLGDYEEAFGVLTQYRRRIRRKHADNINLPIIFNDYMNCLMGDPDEDKIKALIEPVLKAGAEYFVIDCGWYADDSNWWDDVGEWEPSKKRFPSGFKELLDHIRERGLVPGVWLEPEVVGVRSVVGNQLPEEAFFHEHGHRIVEKGRFQLDYRHSEVRDRMDKVVDNLVLNYGVGYFKFDYNIDVVQGTDINTFSPGAAALEHNRAYLKWVNGLYDRHPDLVIESCSSGAQRMDYAMLATHSLQSTSDQQDPIRYAAISASAPTAVTPEQSAVWAYPQPNWGDEVNAMTVVNSLLGRIHLSGTLAELSSSQLELIRSGMDVYKQIRSDVKDALPLWPLGLPKWHDRWLALALAIENRVYLAVWRRDGGPDSINLPLPSLRGKRNVKVALLYPAQFQADYSWEDKGELVVKLESSTAARLFRLDYEA